MSQRNISVTRPNGYESPKLTIFLIPFWTNLTRYVFHPHVKLVHLATLCRPEMANVNRPRVLAQINGTVVDSVIQVDVTFSGSFRSSQFELTVSVGNDPANTPWLAAAPGQVAVEIIIASQATGFDTTLIQGLADSISFDPMKMIARLQGRDYSSILMGTSYEHSFLNQTASEIAGVVAERHGFVQNITRTASLVGSYRGKDYNVMSLGAYSHITNEWDLLVHLAKIEQFEMFVDGTTLIFGPRSMLISNYMTLSTKDTKDIRFWTRCCPTNQARLTIKSWNSWLSQEIQYTAQSASAQIKGAVSVPVLDPEAKVVVLRPNLTPRDLKTLAQLYLNAKTERDLCIDITMPGDSTTKPYDLITFVGTGTDFDGNYVVRSIRKRFSPASGFLQYIRGCSPSTLSSGTPV